MGNQSCVEAGATPQSMSIILKNSSSKTLTLCGRQCQCGAHKGFSADRGKFKVGYEPREKSYPNSTMPLWMSGREGTTLWPDGWIEYDIEDGGTLLVRYNSTDGSSPQNSTNVVVNVANCATLLATVVKNKCDMFFDGTFPSRQFEVTLVNVNNSVGKLYIPIALKSCFT
jgi:hypothetical protein